MNYKAALHSSLSADQQIRESATFALAQQRKTNFGPYLLGLIGIVEQVPTSKDEASIHLAAALSFKNAIRSRNDSLLQKESSTLWLSVSKEASSTIKQKLLSCLDCSASLPARNALMVAQCLSSVISLDLPLGRWPEALSFLLERSSTKEDSVGKTSLEAIGFLCEIASKEAEDGTSMALVDALTPWSNRILTAVVQSLTRPSLRLSGARALLNSVGFISEQMEKEPERTAIIRTLCEGVHYVSGDAQQQQLEEDFINQSIECLSRLLTTYYSIFAPYIESGVGPILRRLMECNGNTGNTQQQQQQQLQTPPSIIMSCLEFWTSLAEVEVVVGKNRHSLLSLPSLLPLLLPLLKEHGDADGSSGVSDDGVSDDEWCISMAATTCLELFTECCGDHMLSTFDGATNDASTTTPPPVVNFIIENIKDSQSWTARDAAVLLFGSLMDGTSDAAISSLLSSVLPAVLVLLLQDPYPAVRDSSAWAVGRFADHHPSLALSCDEAVLALFDPLLTSLKSDCSGGVRVNASWALHCIITHLGGSGDERLVVCGANGGVNDGVDSFTTTTTTITTPQTTNILYQSDRISTLVGELMSLGISSSPPNNVTISALQSLSGCILCLPNPAPAPFVENLYAMAVQVGDGGFGSDPNIITIWSSLMKKIPLKVGPEYFLRSLKRSCQILSSGNAGGIGDSGATDVDEELWMVMSACIEGLEGVLEEEGAGETDRNLNSFISDMLSLIQLYITNVTTNDNGPITEGGRGAMGTLGDVARLVGSGSGGSGGRQLPLSQATFASLAMPFLESFLARLWRHQLETAASSFCDDLRCVVDCVTDIVGNLGCTKLPSDMESLFIGLALETYQSKRDVRSGGDGDGGDDDGIFDLYESLCNVLLSVLSRKEKIMQVLPFIQDILVKARSGADGGAGRHRQRLMKAGLGLYGDLVLLAGPSSLEFIGTAEMVYWIREYCIAVIGGGGGGDNDNDNGGGVPEWTLSVLAENHYYY